MYKRLLLPLDLTDKHAQAVATAVELAAHSAGSVTLLHVIELIPGLPREEDPPFYDRLVQTAQAHLDHIGPAFADKEIPCQAVIAFGNRVEGDGTLRDAEPVRPHRADGPNVRPRQSGRRLGEPELQDQRFVERTGVAGQRGRQHAGDRPDMICRRQSSHRTNHLENAHERDRIAVSSCAEDHEHVRGNDRKYRGLD